MSLPRSYNRGMIDHHSDTFALNERQILFEASGACDNFAANAFRKDCNKQKKKNEGLNTDSIPIHSPNPLPLDEDEAAAPPPERTGSRKETAYQIYRDLILENIEYDTLTQNPRIDREQLDEIVDILLETVCTNRKSIRVAGDDYPAELVKAKFLKLDSHHIEFVMDCLRDNTTKVRNIKQYLRAMLFNAPSTINSYYASLVAHDMAQPDWGRPPNT